MFFHRFQHVAICLAVVALGSAGLANSDGSTVFPQDVTDERTWARNHVLVMRVVEVRNVGVLPRQGMSTMRHVTLTIVESFTPEADGFVPTPPGTRTFPESWFMDPTTQFGVLSNVAAGDQLLVITSTCGQSTLFCRHIVDKPTNARLVKPVRTIGELRRSDKLSDLFAAASDGDATVARYALNRLLAHDALDASPGEVNRIRNLRNSTNCGSVPLLASRLASRLSGKPEMNAEEYEWLIKRLSQFHEQDVHFVLRHLRRLLKYRDERAHIIDQLVGVINDRVRPSPVRSACLGVLSELHLLQFDAPDAHSEKLVETATAALEDDVLNVRRSASITLYHMASAAARSQAPESTRHRWINHVKTALRNAHERETEQVVRWSLEASLRRLDGVAVVPESKERDQ